MYGNEIILINERLNTLAKTNTRPSMHFINNDTDVF